MQAEYTAAAKPPFAEKQIVLYNYITYCTRGAMQQRAFSKKYSGTGMEDSGIKGFDTHETLLESIKSYRILYESQAKHYK